MKKNNKNIKIYTTICLTLLFIGIIITVLNIRQNETHDTNIINSNEKTNNIPTNNKQNNAQINPETNNAGQSEYQIAINIVDFIYYNYWWLSIIVFILFLLYTVFSSRGGLDL